MPLTKANAKSRIADAVNDQATPQEVKDLLNELMDRDRTRGRTPAQVMSRIDAYLDRSHAQWTVTQTQHVIRLLQELWTDIPDA